MKTKFSLELSVTDALTDALSRMTANHNAGNTFISMWIIEAYVKGYYAQFPTLYEGYTLHASVKDGTLTVLNKDDKVQFVITEKHLYDLNEGAPLVEHALILNDKLS